MGYNEKWRQNLRDLEDDNVDKLIKDIYHNINELLEQSHMVHGDNDECGSRVLGIRQEYNTVLDRIEEYWGLEQF